MLIRTIVRRLFQLPKARHDVPGAGGDTLLPHNGIMRHSPSASQDATVAAKAQGRRKCIAWSTSRGPYGSTCRQVGGSSIGPLSRKLLKKVAMR